MECARGVHAGFVAVIRHARDVCNLAHGLGEIQISWRVVTRIGAKNHERVNLARVHALDKFRQAHGVVSHWLHVQRCAVGAK